MSVLKNVDSRFVLAFALIAAIPLQAVAGFHVGNPKVGMHPLVTDGWSVSTTNLNNAIVEVSSCSGSTTALATPIAGSNPPQWTLPVGTWCEGTVDFAPLTIFTADDDEGRHLEVHVDLGVRTVLFDSSMEVNIGSNDDAVFIELGSGGWLALAKQYLEPNETSIILTGDPGYGVVRNELRTTLWYVDDNGDSALSAAERAVGAFGTP